MTAHDRAANAPQSVTRVIRILEALCASSRPLSLAELSRLLASLSPRLNPGRFVFCSVPQPTVVQVAAALGSFREAEGTTLILAREEAERLGLAYDYLAAWITLLELWDYLPHWAATPAGSATPTAGPTAAAAGAGA